MTSDRGLFTMEFDHYDEVPSHLTAKLLEGFKREADEDPPAVGARRQHGLARGERDVGGEPLAVVGHPAVDALGHGRAEPDPP